MLHATFCMDHTTRVMNYRQGVRQTQDDRMISSDLADSSCLSLRPQDDLQDDTSVLCWRGLTLGGLRSPKPNNLITRHMNLGDHDTCVMIVVHACTMIIVHVCTVSIAHARTRLIVRACTMIIVHACTMILVHVL